MTPKQSLDHLVRSLRDDASLAEVLPKVQEWCMLHEGILSLDSEEARDHDEFFDELMQECDANVASFEKVMRIKERNKAEGRQPAFREQILDLLQPNAEATSLERLIYEMRWLNKDPEDPQILSERLGVNMEELLDEDDDDGPTQGEGSLGPSGSVGPSPTPSPH